MSIRIAILLILTTTFCIRARAQYADTSSNKDSLIARLRMELASKEDEIIRKQVLLNEREREIFEKELTIDRLNRSISRQSQAITDQVDRLKDQKSANSTRRQSNWRYATRKSTSQRPN